MPTVGQITVRGRLKKSGKWNSRILKRKNWHIPKCVQDKFYRLPFFQDAISAGFPNQASEEIEDTLDLNALLIQRPAATFFIRVSGSSMVKAGIHHQDILIVDRSIEPSNGKVVIAVVNGELIVKRLLIHGTKVQLISENDSCRPIEISGDMELHIWGVVTNVIHPL